MPYVLAFGLSMWEMMLIAAIALLLFGAKLPEVARSAGKSYRAFKDGISDLQRNVLDTARNDTGPDGTPHAEQKRTRKESRDA